MVFNRLPGHDSSGEPAGDPTLYPDLDPLQLERFLTDLDYGHIKSFDNVYILPFARRNSEPAQMGFGFGLSRLMIRNLMLLRNVSIHGPEDTSNVPYEAIRDVVRAQPRSCHVTGVADFGTDGYSLQVEAHRPGRVVNRTRVGHKNFRVFLRICSTAVTGLLGSQVDDHIVQGWNTAQPRDAKSLVQLGRNSLRLQAPADGRTRPGRTTAVQPRPRFRRPAVGHRRGTAGGPAEILHGTEARSVQRPALFPGVPHGLDVERPTAGGVAVLPAGDRAVARPRQGWHVCADTRRSGRPRCCGTRNWAIACCRAIRSRSTTTRSP